LLANEWRLDPIKGPKQTRGKIVYANPDFATLFNFHPGVSLMQIKSLGNLKPFDVKDVYRSDNGMYSILVVKILIKLTFAAVVILGAGLKSDSTLHVMNTWPYCRGQIFQSIFPEYDLSLFSFRGPALLSDLLVFLGHAPNCSIKLAGYAVKIAFAKLASNHSCLHPEASIFRICDLIFHAVCFHFIFLLLPEQPARRNF